MKIKTQLSALIVAAFLLSSCSQKIFYAKSVSIVDYSAYQRQGMFLTESNSVNFEYEAIGSVTVVVFSGNVVMAQTSHVEKSDLYGEQTVVSKKMGWKTASPEDALEAAVAQAAAKGGDGLINIQISPTTEIDASKNTRSGFLVTGMAIKRM